MIKVTEKRLIPELKKGIDRCGSLSKWARENQFSRQFVNDVLNEKRPMPDSMCKALGIQRLIKVTYYWIEEDDDQRN